MTLRLIYFDTETTGTRTDIDRIVEIAAYDPVSKKTYSSFVNPQRSIPKESIAISGITDEMVKNAPTFDIVLQDFIQFCNGPVALIAHNAENFDVPLLVAEAKRAKIALPTDWIFLDSLKWARKYRRDLPRHSLQYLRQSFEIPPNQAHRALADVYMLEEIFSLMIDDLTVEQLIERMGKVTLKNQQGQAIPSQQLELLPA